jgi:hypothetical protein
MEEEESFANNITMLSKLACSSHNLQKQLQNKNPHTIQKLKV